jgi:hypothetical protein
MTFSRTEAPLNNDRNQSARVFTALHSVAGATYHDALRESFDRVWQTYGRFGSINYTDGKWSAEISRD